MGDDDNWMDIVAALEEGGGGPAHHAAYHPGFGKEPRINDRRFISRSNRTNEVRPAPDNREAGRRNIPKQGVRRPGGYQNFDRWLRDHERGPKHEITLHDIHHENVNFLHHGRNEHNFLRPLISYSEKNANNKSCAYGKYKDGDRYRCIKNPDHHTKIRRFGPERRPAQVAAPAQRRVRGAIPAPVVRRSSRIANKK